MEDLLETIIVCPYCCEQNQLDPPKLCCGELHAEEAYLIDDEVILKSEYSPKEVI